MKDCYAFTSGRGMIDTMPIMDGTLVSRVWVHPGERGHGYGTQLLRWVCEAADREQRKLYLTILARTDGPPAEALRAWYEKHGFAPFVTDDPNFRGDTDAMVREPRPLPS